MAIANLVLKNAAAADLTFTADRAEGDSLRYVYKPANSSMQEWVTLTISRKSPVNKASGALVCYVDIDYPVVDPTTKLMISRNRHTAQVTVPVKSPVVTNNDMAAMLKSLYADAVFQSFVKDGSIPQG